MDILAIQDNKVLNFSRETTRASTENLNVKAELAATNHPCWILTSGLSIMEKDNKFYINITKRLTTDSVKSRRIGNSRSHTRIATDIDLSSFRLSKEKISSATNVMRTVSDLSENKNYILMPKTDDAVPGLSSLSASTNESSVPSSESKTMKRMRVSVK